MYSMSFSNMRLKHPSKCFTSGACNDVCMQCTARTRALISAYTSAHVHMHYPRARIPVPVDHDVKGHSNARATPKNF